MRAEKYAPLNSTMPGKRYLRSDHSRYRLAETIIYLLFYLFFILQRLMFDSHLDQLISGRIKYP